MTYTPDMQPSHDDGVQYRQFDEKVLDMGPTDDEGIDVILVPRVAAEAFVYDGQPLSVVLPGDMRGTEYPDVSSVKQEGRTRHTLQANFSVQPSEEALQAGIVPEATPTLHGLEVVLPKVRAWRRNNPPMARVTIDMLQHGAGGRAPTEPVSET